MIGFKSNQNQSIEEIELLWIGYIFGLIVVTPQRQEAKLLALMIGDVAVLNVYTRIEHKYMYEPR